MKFPLGASKEKPSTLTGLFFMYISKKQFYLILLPFSSVIIWHIFNSDFLLRSVVGVFDLAVLLFMPITFLLRYFCRSSSDGKPKKLHEIYLVVGLLAIASSLVVVFFAIKGNETTGIYIIYGALLATLGWLWSSYNSTLNSTKSHTLNILLHMRDSDVVKVYKEIAKLFDGQPITNELILNKASESELSSDEIHDKIGYVTNYMEFICAAYQCGNLQEKMLILTVRGVIVRWYELTCEYILEEATAENGQINDRLYGNFITTAKYFDTK